MRKSAFFIFLFLISQNLLAQSCAEYKKMFWDQIASTCAPRLLWEKSITEIAENGTSTTETKQFEIDCFSGLAKNPSTTIPLNPAEFGHLFEYAFDNPYISDKFQVVRWGPSVEAKSKPGENNSKLISQRFEVALGTNKLMVAQAHIIKSSPLYDLEVKIMVSFDVNGHYSAHEVETRTDVLLGGTVHTLIKARLL
jgi:hypothetical protein